MSSESNPPTSANCLTEHRFQGHCQREVVDGTVGHRHSVSRVTPNPDATCEGAAISVSDQLHRRQPAHHLIAGVETKRGQTVSVDHRALST